MKMNPVFTRKIKALWAEWVASGVLTQAGAALEGNYSGGNSQELFAGATDHACHSKAEERQ
ncbi:hypothetical protein [Tatumella terrea]|uniref:Uncharacterized protein n=1 Tax=Tatumella terrea TaxID=419007 RepID=A0ABW1VXC0_9GAMM